jgi:hypothetical protein
MLETLITNKTRLKLLLKFFLNSKSRSYLRNLESEFDESTNSIRIELNRFEKAGLLSSSLEGNKKIYFANNQHPLYEDIRNILKKYVGVDQIIDKVIRKLGGVKEAYITGNLSKGLDSKSVNLTLVGEEIDEAYLGRLAEKIEKLIKRKIKYNIITVTDVKSFIIENPDALLIFEL